MMDIRSSIGEVLLMPQGCRERGGSFQCGCRKDENLKNPWTYLSAGTVLGTIQSIGPMILTRFMRYNVTIEHG